jgi:hypothetical protein
MVLLRFKATPKQPRWLHKKGGTIQSTYAGQPTTKVAPRQWLDDGDEVEMDAFEANHCLRYSPDNFSLADAEDATETLQPDFGL